MTYFLKMARWPMWTGHHCFHGKVKTSLFPKTDKQATTWGDGKVLSFTGKKIMRWKPESATVIIRLISKVYLNLQRSG